MRSQAPRPTIAKMVTLGLALAMAAMAVAAPVGHWQFEGTAGGAVGIESNALSPGFLDGTGENGAVYSGSVVFPTIVDPLTGAVSANATSLNMEGSRQVRVADNAALDSASFTIESFVQVGQQGGYPAYIAHRHGGPDRGWQLDINPSEYARTRFDTAAAANQVVGSQAPQSLADGQWHHTAVTFDATTNLITHYTDYTAVATRTLNGSATDATAVAADLILGGPAGYPSGSALDEVRYSNSVLAADQFLRPGSIGHWRFEGTPGSAIGTVPNQVLPGFLDGAGEGGESYSADTPANRVTDPISGRMYKNTSSLDLSGTGRVRVANDPALDPSAFTVEGFVKVQDQGGYPNYINRFVANTSGWQLDINPNEYARARIDTGVANVPPYLGNQVVGSTAAQSLADGDWHHVAMTFEGNQARLYVDYGNLASRTITGDVSLVYQAATDLLFGSSTFPAGSALDEVRYSAGALSPTQFLRAMPLAHWRYEGVAGAAVGLVPNADQPGMLDGTGEGGAVYAADIPDSLVYDPIDRAVHANATSLDMNSGQVRVPNQPLLNSPEFTMETFVKVQDQGGYPSFITRLIANDSGWQLDVNPSEYARARIDTAAQVNQVVGSQAAQSLADREWHHVALTFDGSQMQLYVDHSSVATRALNGDPADVYAVARDLILGSSNWPAGSYIDESRYTGRVLSQEEFLRAVNVGHWRFEGAPGAAIGTEPNAMRPGDLDGTGQGGAQYAADTPGPWIHDPLNGTLTANTASLDMDFGNVRVADDGKLDAPGFTIETFVKVQDQGGYPAFIDRLNAGKGWQLDVDPEEDARARIDTDALVNQTVGSGSAQSLADGDWHHVALTFDGDQMQLFVDYGNVATRALNGSRWDVTDLANDLILGGNWPTGSFLDEARLTAMVLRPDQFLQTREHLTTIGHWRMQDGAPGTQATGIGSEVHNDRMASVSATSGLTFSPDVPLSHTYDPVAGTLTPNTGSVRIGSGNQYFDIDTSTLLHEPSGDFTIEAFVKVDDETERWQSMIGKRRGGGWTWLLDVRGEVGILADKFAIRVDSEDGQGNGQFNQTLTTGAVIKDGMWHHIAATFDDELDLFQLFVDYELAGQMTLANGGELMYDGSPLQIGGSFIGWLDEVRLSGIALTPDQFLRAVPEPATLSLLGLGSLALLRRRRRP